MEIDMKIMLFRGSKQPRFDCLQVCNVMILRKFQVGAELVSFNVEYELLCNMFPNV
jgi:hypothetical protein